MVIIKSTTFIYCVWNNVSLTLERCIPRRSWVWNKHAVPCRLASKPCSYSKPWLYSNMLAMIQNTEVLGKFDMLAYNFVGQLRSHIIILLSMDLWLLLAAVAAGSNIWVNFPDRISFTASSKLSSFGLIKARFDEAIANYKWTHLWE